MLRNTTPRQVLILVVLAVFLRIFNFSSPAFTADEARIAFRGYELSRSGVDELGRRFPYLFNSLDDYQLPVASYLSALGAVFFGKSDLGARIPFILMGLILVLLTYKVATQLSNKKAFHFLSAFLVATSPVLIFVSKVPNESIITITLFLLLFYLFNKDRLNLITIVLVVIMLFLTSKFSWFIVTPFVVYIVFVYRNSLPELNKFKISLISLIFTVLALVIYLKIPQGARSLLENNLLLFSDISIINGINWIRGQGIQSGWPPILERILISKAQFFQIGILHWLSNMQPAVFFSQFSKDGSIGFINMGAFPKAAIIPAFTGLVFLIRKKGYKLLFFPVLITLPTALIYPQLSPQIVILTLPFLAYILTFGLLAISPLLRGLIIFLMVAELLINISLLSPQIKLTNELRPNWIEPIVQDAYRFSNTGQVFISDNITQDPASFILWYTSLKQQNSFSNISYPYKIRQTIFDNVRLVGFSENFWVCDKGKKTKLFLTKRDLFKVRNANGDNIVRTYLDNKGEVIAYFVEENICLY